jgi:hypothetical protein
MRRAHTHTQKAFVLCFSDNLTIKRLSFQTELRRCKTARFVPVFHARLSY